MPFHFTLAAVLRLHDSLEKAEMQRLQAAVARVNEVRSQIEILDAEMQRLRKQSRETATTSGVTGAELHFEIYRENAYRKSRADLVKLLAECEKARQQQLLRYIEAHRQREIFASIRDRQLTAYEIEQARRAQQRIDELFLLRRGNKTAQS